MIRRLKLFQSDIEKEFEYACIDKSHNKIRLQCLRKIYENTAKPQYLQELLPVIRKQFSTSNLSLKIKLLILLHYLIRKTFLPEILSFASEELDNLSRKSAKVIESPNKNSTRKRANSFFDKARILNEQKSFIETRVVDFYVKYIRKFIASEQSYRFAKRKVDGEDSAFENDKKSFNLKNLDTTCNTKLSITLQRQTSKNQENRVLNQINHGFQLLNLINLVLQAQESFNKMGRYFIDHEEILNLFLMYLDDMTLYYDYTRRLSKSLTPQIGFMGEEQIKHCFLFLTEYQKSSDRLYEFFYNRYYYPIVKKLIFLPTFLAIDNGQFERVVKEVKRIDKSLVLAVKESKYSQEYKLNKTMSCITEPSLSKRKSSTSPEKYAKLNRTVSEMGEVRHSMIGSSENRQIEENIMEYIECVNEIDDD